METHIQTTSETLKNKTREINSQLFVQNSFCHLVQLFKHSLMHHPGGYTIATVLDFSPILHSKLLLILSTSALLQLYPTSQLYTDLHIHNSSTLQPWPFAHNQ